MMKSSRFSTFFLPILICAFFACLAVPSSAQTSTPSRGELGVSLLNPGGINLVAVRPLVNRLGLKMSGGYLGSTWGFQGNLYVVLRRGHPIRHDLALIAGTWNHDTKSAGAERWTYGGIAYNFHLRRFFVETSLQLGEGDCDCDGYLTFELGFTFPAPRR
jgi:hypothetical protein